MFTCTGATYNDICQCVVTQQDVQTYTGSNYNTFKSICPVATCLHTSAYHITANTNTKGIDYPLDFSADGVSIFLGIKDKNYVYLKEFNRSFHLDLTSLGTALDTWMYQSDLEYKSKNTLKIILTCQAIIKNKTFTKRDVMSTREVVQVADFTVDEKECDPDKPQVELYKRPLNISNLHKVKKDKCIIC